MEEFANMALLGTFRMLESELGGFVNKNEADRLPSNDLKGILGEAAVMKAMGRDVHDLAVMQREIPHAEKGQGDVPSPLGRVEVRSTTGLFTKMSRSGPGFASRLIARDGDDPDKSYVLVLGVGTVYEIAGWLKGSEIKRDEWAGQGAAGRTPAWMAPVSALRPIRELLAVNHKIISHELQSFIIDEKPKPKFDLELEMLGRPTSVAELWRQAEIIHGVIE